MNPTYEDPFDNNASQKQLKTDRMFGFIYLVRSHIPSNHFLFHFLFPQIQRGLPPYEQPQKKRRWHFHYL